MIRTNSVEVSGITYKRAVAVALKPTIDFQEPSFGQIQEIYVAGSSTYFYIKELETKEYNEHYCVYVTNNKRTFRLVNLQSISSYLPLSLHKLVAFPCCLCLVPKFLIV